MEYQLCCKHSQIQSLIEFDEQLFDLGPGIQSRQANHSLKKNYCYIIVFLNMPLNGKWINTLINTTSAASTATSVPEAIAIPTSA